MADESGSELIEAINAYSAEFDSLCQIRHEAGKAEYGAFTFLGNDVTRMMMEELADTANYCRMQFIKLMMLQGALTNELKEKGHGDTEITIGLQAFQGTKKGWERDAT